MISLAYLFVCMFSYMHRPGRESCLDLRGKDRRCCASRVRRKYTDIGLVGRLEPVLWYL